MLLESVDFFAHEDEKEHKDLRNNYDTPITPLSEHDKLMTIRDIPSR